ncbi:hypothetical protein CASFOL_002549 [Castilleja foliolosa]|uniref:Uncharacterized protein n=1 Tax=Castilleja foliolosa TaxID=1961234 RepID=A0ABD3EEM8_9LAMI
MTVFFSCYQFHRNKFSSDGVVPDRSKNEYPNLFVDGFPAYGVDYPVFKPLIIRG